ncbi:ABC transporter permease [Azospirillum endophyticum]
MYLGKHPAILSEQPPVRSLSNPKSRLRVAANDLVQGAGLWGLWGLMAWFDIKQKYRGSLLGPFWITISTAVMVASIGTVYSHIFAIDMQSYLPFLSLGILIWGLISGMITEFCSVFLSNESVIKQIRMPFSVHVYRLIARNFVIFAHHVPVYIAVALYCHVELGWGALLALPGIALLVITAIPVAVFLGMICARFRDVAPIVQSMLQLLFFVTPIIWRPEALKENLSWAYLNPFYALIEIVRAPLMGQMPPAALWSMAVGAAAVSWLVAFPFFARFRARIAYWL